jgi:hypothetical protein
MEAALRFYVLHQTDRFGSGLMKTMKKVVLCCHTFQLERRRKQAYLVKV